MHSIKVILAGLVLWGVFFFGRAWLLPDVSRMTAFATFAVLWVVVSIVNLAMGMRQGYSLVEELPYFLLVCGVPLVLGFLGRDW
jgi:hypothetical protein